MGERVWEDLSQKLRRSAPYRALLQGAGDVVRLPVPAAAWVGALLAEESGRPLLVVVPREADALSWMEGAELFVGTDSAVFFPAPSLTPYQETDVSLSVRAQESVALDRVLSRRARMLVATPRALFRRLPTPEVFAAAVVEVRLGEERPREEWIHHLLRHGYRRRDLVAEVGDFAVRGGILDLYPPGEPFPIRLDLFGDVVESIRRFDPESQRSREELAVARILPLSLFPAGPGEATKLAALLASELGSELGLEGARRLEDLRRHGSFRGWEGYLPLLAGETLTLPELLSDPLMVAVDPPALAAEAEHHVARLQEDYEARKGRHLAIPPQRLEHPGTRVADLLAGAQIRLRDLMPGLNGGIDFRATPTDVFHGQLPRFPREVETARARGERVVLVAPAGHHPRLAELLKSRDLPMGAGGVELIPGELSRGFRLPAAGVAVYGEEQLLPPVPAERRGAPVRFGPFIPSLRDLKVGDYVVHMDHGIGQFLGLRTVRSAVDQEMHLPPTLRPVATGDGAVETEVMEIAYAGGRRLLLPVSRMDLLQRYSGIEGIAPGLDELGGTSWNRTKRRVGKSLREMAGELLRLYAERELAQAPAMPPASDLLRQFEAAFAYEETPDQVAAIRAIQEDLERERPMDRLLCGDVGYGKTEVAMRAAFKVVEGGYQVAVLAPTTILADQHFATFRRRFEGFPVEIDMISRFRTPREIRQIRKRVAEKKVDILIGTHRLISRDVEIPRLGLLIIDEEQRFGVAQKERLKQLKKNVHVLAMSATPVPRTLQLSLAGVRDLSVIETPPKDRMAVETAVVPFHPDLIREAIEFEMERGGQVYYVYNRVETIEEMLVYLQELVPGVRVTVGHGQLEEQELARRMHAFTGGEYDVLLATTIIENGIDIPRVNTMIVHRADRFGLAQLYQLRGRVGRSNQLAYCYLLVPSEEILSEPARKRLAAIQEFTELGAGFRIAARDLEIRGAGNLLGPEQSGHIAAVGMEIYLKMLEETVRELRGEVVPEAPSTAIDLPVPMAIPPDYVEDPSLRMEIYRKIAAGEVSQEELLAELRDRFGAPPPAVFTLLELAALKRQAEELRVQSISLHNGDLVVRLRQDSRVDLPRLTELVSTWPGAGFSPTGVLSVPAARGQGLLATVREVLERVAPS